MPPAQALARLRHDFGPIVLRQLPGQTIVNLQSVDGLPLVLAGLAALAVGLPLGVAAGRWAWDVAATQLQSAAPPAIPALAIVLIVPAALLAGNTLAALPARTAARTAPAISLRQE